MLIKVQTKELRPGMFVADVGRSWFNHPWTTKSKLLTSAGDIKLLMDYGISSVTVDLSKSTPSVVAELSGDKTPVEKVEPEAQVEQPKPEPRKIIATASPEVLSAMEEELPRAAKAYKKTLDTSKALLAACKMNKKIELQAVRENIDELVESVSRNRDALLALIKLRQFDDYTYTHSLNVSVLAISTAKNMGLSDDELKILGLGTMFHDLGKSRIPGHILNKPGKLTDEEFSVMRNHAALSGRIIQEQRLVVDDLVYKIARNHHERDDGSGYPDKLRGDAIPHLVTICGLSDVYDALTSDRVYHKGRSPHEALQFIYGLRGTHFSAEWVDRFVQSVGIYAPGTIVQLNTDHAAVVMDVNPNALHAPLIKVIADPTGMLYSRPKLVNLADEKEAKGLVIKKVVPRDEAGIDPSYYFNIPK